MKETSKRLCAQFETWIVKKPGAIVSELPGKFSIEIRLLPIGKGGAYRYHIFAGTAASQFAGTFAESKLEDAKNFVEAQFKRRISQWEELP
jgi:hypothetical protein